RQPPHLVPSREHGNVVLDDGLARLRRTARKRDASRPRRSSSLERSGRRMTPSDAVDLLKPAIATRGGVWADLGAGEGTFTQALAELLGPESLVYAVDRDANAVAELKRWAPTAPAKVTPVMGDFSLPFDPPGKALLDGMLFANSLHYVRNAGVV